MKNTDLILNHYLACALWASTDGEGDHLDATYCVEDIDDASFARAAVEIEGFLADCAAAGLDLDGLSEEQIGHDLWLTRNGHGAGFWDRGLGQLGEALTQHAKDLGTSDAYAGDDGKVYLT